MCKTMTEYRINKKGAECFRTRSTEEAYGKLKELQAKRPGVYTIQTRIIHLDRYGMQMTDLSGKALWSTWQ